MATLKASAVLDPEDISRSMFSRTCASSSSSGTGVLMPAASICRRHSAICFSKSGIFFPPELDQHVVDFHPLLALFLKRGLAVFLNRVILPFPTVLHRLPTRLDPAVILHAV